VKHLPATRVRLALLLALFSAIALAGALAAVVMLDRQARALRAGEAAAADAAALVDKLKGAAADPAAGPLLAQAVREIRRYAGPSGPRVLRFAPHGEGRGGWPVTAGRLDNGMLLFEDAAGRSAGVVRTLPSGDLLVSRRIEASGPLRPALVRYLLPAGLLLIALSLVAAWVVGRVFAARVGEFNAVFSAVEKGDFEARVPAGRGEGEFEALRRNVNRMLQELEVRIQQLRLSSDRIAHDLRTPLARLETRLGQMLASGLPEPLHAPIATSHREAAGLIETLNALLDLREIETESGLARASFLLNDAAAEAVELFEATAEDLYGVTLKLEGEPVEVTGAKSLVVRAIANIVDNAIHASPRGDTVTVTVRSEPDRAVVEVRDHGDGIGLDAASEGAILKSAWGGHGIGLSVVRAVARRHGGDYSLVSDGTGTVGTLRLAREGTHG
jgi:signal transduction histidine kinase